MVKTTQGLLKLPKIIEQMEVDPNKFPGLTSRTLGGPNSLMKPRKSLRKVTNISDEDKLSQIANKIRDLVSEEEVKTAARDFRLSEIQKLVSIVIPYLASNINVGVRDTLNKDEKSFLSFIIKIGMQFARDGKKLNRINPQLAEAITSLGKVLQGLAL